MSLYPLEAIQSESIALKLLKERHPKAQQSSLYRNAAKIAASARLTNRFKETAELADLSIQPLLRYYALLHGMKTVMYVRDLSYPISSSVLQHGISVRRNKRETYSWPKESVHVYKEGVLQSYAGLHDVELPVGSRIVVGDLLGHLPHLHGALVHGHPEHHHVYPVHDAHELGVSGGVSGSAHGGDSRSLMNSDGGFAYRYVPRLVASNRSKTVHEWRNAFLQEFGSDLSQTFSPDVQEPDGYLAIPAVGDAHPWIVHVDDRHYVFDSTPPPTWLIHFVVLYSLSALCRYNPVEWSDITLWNNDSDGYLVREYLRKFPMETILGDLM